MRETISVFLADDNLIAREGVRALLALEDDLEVGTARRTALRPRTGEEVLAEEGGEDVGEAGGRERNDPRTCRPGVRGQRRLDVPEADGADLTVHLREDVRRVELAQKVRIDPVDGKAFRDERRHGAVNLLPRALRVELRCRADREILDFVGKVALV